MIDRRDAASDESCGDIHHHFVFIYAMRRPWLEGVINSRFLPAHLPTEHTMASASARSCLVPRDITKTGKLAADIWLIGTVVRLREFKSGAEQTLAPSQSGGKAQAKGKKGAAKGKKGAKESKQQSQSNEGMEIHLNGGDTPADVMMLHSWDEKACKALRPFFKKGEKLMVSKVYIKEHTEKTSAWVTSRHAFFGVMDASSGIQRYEGEAAWVQYHPTTPLSSLRHVPHNTFVCLAGMVLSPGPKTKHETVDGESLPITNFQVRAKDGIVNVEAWRDTADYAGKVMAGQIYYFDSIKKISPDKKDVSLSVARYQKQTAHGSCEKVLEEGVRSATEDSATGATVLSPVGPVGVKKDAASYKVEDSNWVSLSTLAAIISGDNMRRLEGALQVPSVLLKPVGDKITYRACADCLKAVYETKSCQCATTETKIRFRADIRMEDDTYQINAVIFDAMEPLVTFFADGDDTKSKPAYYHEDAAHVEELSMTIEAMPCTVLVALEENSYKENIEISLKAVEQTFSSELSKIRHPLKPILRCALKLRTTSITPPCLVADTSFEAGAGVTLVPGGTAQKFRALLTVLDKQATTERLDDASPAVRCTRKVCCALQREDDATTYVLSSVGPINFATRLHAPRKGETLHAIVSWRSATELALLAFMTPGDGAEGAAGAADFKTFFATEARLNKTFHVEPTRWGVQFADGDTPSKKHKEAIDAARKLATPEPWAKRNRCE